MRNLRLKSYLDRQLKSPWLSSTDTIRSEPASPLQIAALSQHVNWAFDEGATASKPDNAPVTSKAPTASDGPEVLADRPFVFLVLDLHTRTPVLMGHLIHSSTAALKDDQTPTQK